MRKEKSNKHNKKTKTGAFLKIALVFSLLIIAGLSAALVYVTVQSPVNVITGTGKILTGRSGIRELSYSYYEKGRGKKLLTPYEDHGLGTGMMCEVIVPYGECTDGAEESNSSDPLYSPLARGTVDRVLSVAGTAEQPVYVLESGVKINDEYIKITDPAYLMPENTLRYYGAEPVIGGIKLLFETDWAVPVRVTLDPQSYFTGYDNRAFNVAEFSAKYLDIHFSRTVSLDALPDISGLDVVKKCVWIGGEGGGTLRLYFKKSGQFYGYSYELDRNGRFAFVIKKNIRQDATPTVILDPGHGGTDPGAASVDGAVLESLMTLDIANQAAEMLSERGIRVVMTRRDDVFVSLDERALITRKYSPDLFVAIHCDSEETGEAYGTHTFYYKNYSAPLAQSIQKYMAQVYGELYPGDAAADKGTKFYPFAVTRVEECPSVLVECGYLTNESNCAFINSAAGRIKIADAIVRGILEQLNVKF
ncbi:MAG: N-acetylmuramoyl-L-alanine amidase [Clostridia bacterium]|nr:N-acetylmuramoyl-L-alanine amidase [Clostridia bacterium]